MGKMSHIKYIGFLIIILFTQFYCRREFDNPVDTEVLLEEVKSLIAEQEGEWIRLSWLKQDRVTGGYDIERREGDQSFKLLISIEDPNITTYLDTSITTDQSYIYRIRGYSDENFTPYANEIIFRVNFPVPYGLDYQIDSDSSITISWQDSASFESGSIIERNSSLDTTWQVVGQTETDSTEFTDSGLSYNIDYMYRIKSLTTNNRSDYSETLVAKIFMVAPHLESVNPLNDHQMRIEWIEDITFENGFIVERRQNYAMDWHQVGRVNENVTIFIDDSLKVQYSYSYRIKAFSDKNSSNYSNQLIGQTSFPAPVNLAINSWTPTSIVLTWSDLEFEEGYLLKHVVTGQMDTVIQTLSQNTTSYQIVNLDTGFTYLINIQGFTAHNNSAQSESEINFTQQASLHHSFLAHEYSVSSIAFSKDGQILASGGAEGDVHIWTVEQWSNIKTIAGDTIQEGVKNLAFVSSDSYLLVGYDYSYLKLFEVPSWNFYQDINLITYQLNNIAHVESTGKLAVVKYKFIYVWSTSSWSLEKTFTASNQDVFGLAYDSDGQWLASTDEEEGIKIWETTNWAEMQVLDEHTESVQVLSVSANGQWLASGGRDNNIIIWNTDTWTSINTLVEHHNDVALLSFSTNNSWLASVEKMDYRIVIWSTEDWQIEQTIQITSPGEITSIVFSSDGKYLLVGDANGKIWIWQFAGSWVLSF